MRLESGAITCKWADARKPVGAPTDTGSALGSDGCGRPEGGGVAPGPGPLRWAFPGGPNAAAPVTSAHVQRGMSPCPTRSSPQTHGALMFLWNSWNSWNVELMELMELARCSHHCWVSTPRSIPYHTPVVAWRGKRRSRPHPATCVITCHHYHRICLFQRTPPFAEPDQYTVATLTPPVVVPQCRGESQLVAEPGLPCGKLL